MDGSIPGKAQHYRRKRQLYCSSQVAWRKTWLWVKRRIPSTKQTTVEACLAVIVGIVINNTLYAPVQWIISTSEAVKSVKLDSGLDCLCVYLLAWEKLNCLWIVGISTGLEPT